MSLGDKPILRTALLVPMAVGLVAHSLWFDFVSDDAFISFVFARNFAEHGELVYNLGDRVEGYTNFLWTLTLGLLMKAGAPPEIASRVLGTLFGVATLGLVVRLSSRVRGAAGIVDLMPAALLAASSGYAAWCSGGLETQMFTGFVVLGLLFVVEERLVAAGVAFAFAALTRPEGVLVFALVSLHRLGANLLVERRLGPRRAELFAAAAFLGIYAPYFAWRWWYYGWPFPNTFYVKAGGEPPPGYSAAMMRAGLFYVGQWATQSKALWAAPLAFAGVFRHPRFGSLGVLLVAGYLGYVIPIGGDFMGLWRFIMPVHVVTFVLVALGAVAVVEHLPTRLRLRVGVPVTLVLLGAFVLSQLEVSRRAQDPRGVRGIDTPGYLRLYAHDRELIGRALAPHIRPDDFAIVGGAGVQSYYARLRGIDVFGLVSERIAHEVRPTNPRPGHQKYAPPSLLLEHRPTFLFYCYDLHRDPSKYRLCREAPLYQQAGYEPVTIHVPGLRERGEYYTFLKRRDRPWP